MFTKTSEQSAKDPSTNAERVKIAVVGLHFGRHIARNELATGPGAPFFKLAALCDMDEPKLTEMTKEMGIKGYASLDALIADPEIPAIALYTGPNGRAKLLRKIIRAGKDVMTTKPFETDPKEALSVLTEARDLGRTIHLNSPAPVLPPDMALVRRWQEEYGLGAPVGCRADVWAHYREQADGSWYDDQEKCPVAPVFRLGIYAINDIVALLGEAEEVHVMESRLLTGRPTADNAQLGIRFKSGALASIYASFCVGDGDHYRNGLVLNFENGTVYRNAGPLRAEPLNEESEMRLVILKNGRRHLAAQASVGASGAYRWDLFHQAIHGVTIPDLLPIATVVDGLKIIHAMAEAESNGGMAKVR
jgi:predicted dehydrogenase